MNAPLELAVATATTAATDEQKLDAALQGATQLVAHAASFALAFDQIGIELPPAHAAQIDPAQLRAIASLYLAGELENTGLIGAVDALAGLLRSGALNLDLGGAHPLLQNWWQNRQQRATEEERRHSFANLFGPEAGFEEAMLFLCEALYKLDENPSNPNYGSMSLQLRVRTLANQLLAQLLQAVGGMTVFLAQEILQSLRAAIAILRHPDLLAALGSRDLWAAIGRIDRLARTSHPGARLFVQRGKAGMTVLAWLADAAPHLAQSSGVLVNLDHPVIPAALEWMQAALAIGEAGNQAGSQADSQAGNPAENPAAHARPVGGGSGRSQWANLAA